MVRSHCSDMCSSCCLLVAANRKNTHRNLHIVLKAPQAGRLSELWKSVLRGLTVSSLELTSHAMAGNILLARRRSKVPSERLSVPGVGQAIWRMDLSGFDSFIVGY